MLLFRVLPQLPRIMTDEGLIRAAAGIFLY